MKCWKCSAHLAFMGGGCCVICKKEVKTDESVDVVEEAGAVYCYTHRTMAWKILNQLSEIFETKFDFGYERGLEQGFEDFKEGVKEEYQRLKNDKEFWQDSYSEENDKVTTKLKQWIELIKKRVN